MKKTTISIVVPTKNEEKNIEDCLRCLTWADELIVVDQQSTDKTIILAQKYTKKIYVHKPGKYPHTANKNYGIKKATKDWIFIVDADERVTSELKNEILRAMTQNTYDAFYFNFRQVFFNKEFIGPLRTQTKIIRLFKQGNGYYDNMSPHATITGYHTAGRILSPMIHLGYPDVETFIRKMNVYTTQHAQMLSEGKPGGLLKRTITKPTFYALFLEPLLFFPYYFLIKQNYKEGIHGFLISLLMMYYLFIERFKFWELVK